jgi:hypothetical protein
MDHLGVITEGRLTQTEIAQQELEIVIPFTTPFLTQAALRRAEALGTGLNCRVRLVKVQVVPYPLELDHPSISTHFLGKQLASMCCKLPIVREIHLARDLSAAFKGILTPNSLTVIASKRRPWKTRQENLAADLWRAGHQVLIRNVEGWDA